MLLHAPHSQFGKPRTQLAKTPWPCIFVRKDDWTLRVSSGRSVVYESSDFFNGSA